MSADDAVLASYESFQSLQTLRYTRATERVDCFDRPSISGQQGHPTEECIERKEETRGEVVFPNTWHERTVTSTALPSELGGNGQRELLVIDGVPYFKSGSGWLKRVDLHLVYGMSKFFLMDVPSPMDDSRLGFIYVGEEQLDGVVTKHYRSDWESYGFATNLDVWVGKEDSVPRKIYRYTEALADAPPPPEPPTDFIDGIPVVVMANKWKADTFIFYDFNTPITIEQPDVGSR